MTVVINGSTGVTLDGAAIGAPNLQIFTSSGTFTAPVGVTKVKATVIGGGGGGGGNFDSGCSPNSGARGGYGGISAGYYTVVPGTGYSITIGSGGAGATSSTQAGSSGSSSSFASFCSATGGGGASGAGNTGSAGAGSSGTLGNSSVGNSAGPFVGANFYTSGSSTPLTWSAASGTVPGAGGGGRPANGSTPATGGVSGVVIIEYVG